MIWLVLVAGFSMMRAILELLLNPERDKFDTTKNVHFFFFVAALIVLYNYAEFSQAEDPRLRRASIFYTSLGIFIGFYVIAHIENWNENPESWPLSEDTAFWEFPLDIAQVIVVAFIVRTFYKMAIFGGDLTTKRINWLLFIGWGTFFIVGILEFSEHFLGKDFHAAILAIPSFAIVLLVYTLKPNLSYSCPVQLNRILIVLEGGLTIIEENLGERYGDKTGGGTMLGSITSSVNTLFQEITKSEGNIEKIQLDTATLLIATSGKVLTVLEVGKSTRFLMQGLKDFTRDFARYYHKEVESYSGNNQPFADYSLILKRYFPFLV
jgi:hypothetical protein